MRFMAQPKPVLLILNPVLILILEQPNITIQIARKKHFLISSVLGLYAKMLHIYDRLKYFIDL